MLSITQLESQPQAYAATEPHGVGDRAARGVYMNTMCAESGVLPVANGAHGVSPKNGDRLVERLVERAAAARRRDRRV